jgi:hypothetical protein
MQAPRAEKQDQLIQRLLTGGLLALAATLVSVALVLYV